MDYNPTHFYMHYKSSLVSGLVNAKRKMVVYVSFAFSLPPRDCNHNSYTSEERPECLKPA